MQAEQNKYHFEHFTVLQQLGKGSFGTVYKTIYQQEDQEEDQKDQEEDQKDQEEDKQDQEEDKQDQEEDQKDQEEDKQDQKEDKQDQEEDQKDQEEDKQDKQVQNNQKDQKDHRNQNKPYAIKVQTIGAIKPMLHLEYQILTKLNKNQPSLRQTQKGFSFPQVLLYKQQEYLSYMAMELLDITFEDFANKEIKNTFSKDCLIRIFYNLLKIIHSIHSLGYVHRDIKPANFMLKLNNSTQQPTIVHQKYLPHIYPIDLGLCKSYINPITRQHIVCKDNKKMVGTAIFCSLNTHNGLEQARRDDIQAIVYMIVYLVKKLPWEIVSNKQVKNQPQSPKKKVMEKLNLEKYEEIYQIKNTTNFDEFLNDLDLLPKCLLQIYKLARKMQFQQEPNYSHIYDLLQKEHFQLTGLKIPLNQFPCKWQNLTINKKQYNLNSQQKKKIKINFKIPTNKLKKPTQNIVQSSHSQIESKQTTHLK